MSSNNIFHVDDFHKQVDFFCAHDVEIEIRKQKKKQNNTALKFARRNLKATKKKIQSFKNT